jgi:hypothetical protein
VIEHSLAVFLPSAVFYIYFYVHFVFVCCSCMTEEENEYEKKMSVLSFNTMNSILICRSIAFFSLFAHHILVLVLS